MSYKPTVVPETIDFLNVEEGNVGNVVSWIKNEVNYGFQDSSYTTTEDIMNRLIAIYLYILERIEMTPNPNFANVYFEGQYVYDEASNESQKGNYFVRDKMVAEYTSASDGSNPQISSWHEAGMQLATTEFLRTVKSIKES